MTEINWQNPPIETDFTKVAWQLQDEHGEWALIATEADVTVLHNIEQALRPTEEYQFIHVEDGIPFGTNVFARYVGKGTPEPTARPRTPSPEPRKPGGAVVTGLTYNIQVTGVEAKSYRAFLKEMRRKQKRDGGDRG